MPTCLSLSLPQKHPEPFFALAKELYPGQFKVSCFFSQGQQKRVAETTRTNIMGSRSTWALGSDCLGLIPSPLFPALLILSLSFPIYKMKLTL